MATTILGIDLGSYSVKVARLDLSFRSMHLISIEEHRVPRPELHALHERPGDGDADSHADGEDGAAAPVPPGPGSAASHADDTLLQRQLRTLEQALHNQRGKGETSVVALGSEVTLRLLEMPFADAK